MFRRHIDYNIVRLPFVYNTCAGELSMTRGSKGNGFSKHVKNFNSCLEFVTVGVKTVSHASREQHAYVSSFQES